MGLGCGINRVGEDRHQLVMGEQLSATSLDPFLRVYGTRTEFERFAQVIQNPIPPLSFDTEARGHQESVLARYFSEVSPPKKSLVLTEHNRQVVLCAVTEFLRRLDAREPIVPDPWVGAT